MNRLLESSRRLREMNSQRCQNAMLNYDAEMRRINDNYTQLENYFVHRPIQNNETVDHNIARLNHANSDKRTSMLVEYANDYDEFDEDGDDCLDDDTREQTASRRTRSSSVTHKKSREMTFEEKYSKRSEIINHMERARDEEEHLVSIVIAAIVCCIKCYQLTGKGTITCAQ